MASPQASTILAERILPARGAAKRASASFSEQLMSSPTRSEGKHSESDSPGSSNPFGGPNSHGTKTIKYRYSATGKHRSSPLKGSSSSPERKIINTSKPRVKPKAKPLPAFTPSASTSASKGKAAAMPSTPRKRKASVSSFRREDTPSSLSALSPLSSVPTSPIVPTKDLPPSSTPMTKWTTPDPSTRLPRIKTISTSSSWPYVSKVSTLSQPLSSPRTKKANMAIGNRGPNTWDVGSSVWILVNESGTLVDDSVQPNNDPDLFEERLWWPAQIVQKQPLRGSLFGDFPSSSSSTRGLCTILVPSPANIQSIYDDTGSKRFTCTTFRIPSSSPADGLISSPPKKKQRLDPSVSTSLEDRWKSAVQSMEKASTLERDGLPALISSYASAGASFYDSLDDSDPDTSDFRQSLRKPTKSTGVVSNTPKSTESPRMLKSQRLKANLKSSNLKGDTTASTTRDWSLCPPDPTLQIPGELVLAQAPKTGASYWPAQLIEHVPGRKERYKVKFLDDEKYVIGRDRFWTSEEEGFVCCTLGQWESAVKTIDDSESGDEGADYDDDDSGDVKDPPPPPPPAEDFEDLSVRAQLAYVKPILQAILNKEYVPAREKHEGFMKGGSARAALLKAAGVRGGMDARFVKAMQRAICQWVLGEDGGRSVRMDAEDVAVDAGREAANTNTVMDGATLKVDPSESAPVESLGEKSMENGMMEGIGGGVGSETTQADSQDGAINESLHPITPLSEIGMEDYEMAVDKPEQPHEAPLPKMSSVDPGPASVKQAPSELKGQLDLLAEVSQAVATEPSLLPSHPELSKIEVSGTLLEDTLPQPSPFTPPPDKDQQLPPRRSDQVGCEEFESLSGIEKLDYCLNILLPESIQQLLLWRNGERTSSALLSPEEEQRLHDVGARKAAETDWVDDVMRLRVAQARLWGIDLSKGTQEEKAEVVPGGTRTRPRRETSR